MKKWQAIVSLTALAGVAVLLVILCRDLYPLLKEIIADTGDESKMISYIDAYGVAKGLFILVGLQMLSVFIPGMSTVPISILAGLCYGVFGGTLISSLGILLPNSIIFLTANKLDRLAINIRSKKKKNVLLDRLLKQNRNPGFAIAAAYLIPFIPNMIIPFVFTARKVSYKTYLIYMSAAVVPSTLVYGFIGDSVAEGNYKTAIIIVAVVFIVLLAVFVLYKNSKKRVEGV